MSGVGIISRPIERRFFDQDDGYGRNQDDGYGRDPKGGLWTEPNGYWYTDPYTFLPEELVNLGCGHLIGNMPIWDGTERKIVLTPEKVCTTECPGLLELVKSKGGRPPCGRYTGGADGGEFFSAGEPQSRRRSMADPKPRPACGHRSTACACKRQGASR